MHEHFFGALILLICSVGGVSAYVSQTSPRNTDPLILETLSWHISLAQNLA